MILLIPVWLDVTSGKKLVHVIVQDIMKLMYRFTEKLIIVTNVSMDAVIKSNMRFILIIQLECMLLEDQTTLQAVSIAWNMMFRVSHLMDAS